MTAASTRRSNISDIRLSSKESQKRGAAAPLFVERRTDMYAAMPAIESLPDEFSIIDGTLYRNGEKTESLYGRVLKDIVLQTERTVYLTAEAFNRNEIDLYAMDKRRGTAVVIASGITEVSCFFQKDEVACFLTIEKQKHREYQEVVVAQSGMIRSRFFGPFLLSEQGKAETFVHKDKAFVILSDSRGIEYVKGKPRMAPRLDGKETSVLVMQFHFGDVVDLRYEHFVMPGSKVGIGAVTEPELAVFISPQDGPARIIR